MKKPTSIILRELDLANLPESHFTCCHIFLYEIKKRRLQGNFRDSKILKFQLN